MRFYTCSVSVLESVFPVVLCVLKYGFLIAIFVYLSMDVLLQYVHLSMDFQLKCGFLVVICELKYGCFLAIVLY